MEDKRLREVVATIPPGRWMSYADVCVAAGGFADDSPTRAVSGSTTFRLNGATSRYFVLWITQLPPGGVAHVNEVRARS